MTKQAVGFFDSGGKKKHKTKLLIKEREGMKRNIEEERKGKRRMRRNEYKSLGVGYIGFVLALIFNPESQREEFSGANPAFERRTFAARCKKKKNRFQYAPNSTAFMNGTP